ncbi:hypothetical protein T484DRAFT_1777713, partial [Baffinella frigidus]
MGITYKEGLAELRRRFQEGEIGDEAFERARIALKNQEAKREKTDGPNSSDSTEPSTAHNPVERLVKKVKQGKEKDVKEMLLKQPSLAAEATDVASGDTLLHLAAANGHKRIAKELLRHAAHFDVYA